MTPLLKVRHLDASYGPVQVLRDVSIDVAEGELNVLLGANGAGKTTTMRAVSGAIPCRGSIQFAGRELVGEGIERTARAGIRHVPQGRGTLSDLTVHENLEVGAYVRRDRTAVSDEVEQWYETFPVLGERRHQRAGRLSGGEQQMLAVARALIARPQLLLLDEPSLGMSPIVTKTVFSILADVNASDGTAMLIVEQNAALALEIAHTAYVMEAGQIVLAGPASEVAEHPDLRQAYLGI